MRRCYKKYIKPKKKISGAELITRRVLAVDIMSHLEENGFKRCTRLETNYGDNSEVVYAKPITIGSRKIIAVYTSCNQSGGAFIAKSSGKDAIRIAGLYINKSGKSCGIIKNRRVNRVGLNEDIIKRLAGRIASTTKSLTTTECCDQCSAPKFLSKKGNLVCSELCWRQ